MSRRVVYVTHSPRRSKAIRSDVSILEGRVQVRNVVGIVTRGGGKLVATLPPVSYRRHAAANV